MPCAVLNVTPMLANPTEKREFMIASCITDARRAALSAYRANNPYVSFTFQRGM